MLDPVLTEAVDRFLPARVPGLKSVTACERLSGGASQETWRVRALTDRGERLIAFRRAPGGEPKKDLRSGPGLDVEARLMQLARAAGVPEPEVLAVLDGSEGLGLGFFMSWLEGEALGARIARHDSFAAIRPTLARQCGEILARIHALDYSGIAHRLDRWTPRDYVQRMWDDYRAFDTPQPMIDFTARWLLENAPTDHRTTLVHNDFRNGNIMISPDSGIVAVLDWEVACIGDPMRDLGWVCTNSWRFGVTEKPVGGFGDYADLFAGYESVSGIRVNPADVKFWEVFGSFWWAIGCLKMADRYRHGPDRTVERPGIGRRSSECQVDCVNLLIPGPVQRTLPVDDRIDDNMPRTEELLVSVRDFLRGDVMGATQGRINFLARVASNSLDIVLRELAHGAPLQAREQAGLEQVLGTTGTLHDLRSKLVRALRDGSMPLDRPGLAAHLRETTVAAVAIDQPVYSGYRTALDNAG